MEDPRFANSPLNFGKLTFPPKTRVAMQVLLTSSFLLAFYGAYRASPKILNAAPSTGLTLPDDVEMPGWVMLFVPVLAIIVGVYMFTFLKYNFNY